MRYTKINNKTFTSRKGERVKDMTDTKTTSSETELEKCQRLLKVAHQERNNQMISKITRRIREIKGMRQSPYERAK